MGAALVIGALVELFEFAGDAGIPGTSYSAGIWWVLVRGWMGDGRG